MSDYAKCLGQDVYVIVNAFPLAPFPVKIGVAAGVKRGHLIVTKDGKLSSCRAPAVVGSETSVEAAQRLEGLNEKERLVYDTLDMWFGLTDEQGARKAALSESTYRARRVYLCDRGLVQDSGERRVTKAGRRAVVWRVAHREDSA